MKINKLIKELKRIKKQSGNQSVGLLIHFENVDSNTMDSQTMIVHIEQCLSSGLYTKPNGKKILGLKLGMYFDQTGEDVANEDFKMFHDCKSAFVQFENGI